MSFICSRRNATSIRANAIRQFDARIGLNESYAHSFLSRRVGARMSFAEDRGSGLLKSDEPIAWPERDRTARVGFGRRSFWLLASVFVALLSGCSDKAQSFPTPATPVLEREYHHLWLITLVTLIVLALCLMLFSGSLVTLMNPRMLWLLFNFHKRMMSVTNSAGLEVVCPGAGSL